MKKWNWTLIWVFTVIGGSLALFGYLVSGDSDAPALQAEIEMTGFKNEQEIVSALAQRLETPLKENRFFWIGLEPEKPEQLDVLIKLKQEIEKHHSLAHVIVDAELGYDKAALARIGPSDVLSVKEYLYDIGGRLQKVEREGKAYLLVTASIYATSYLKKNPAGILKGQYGLKPLTFSLAYFPVTAAAEKNMLFPCRTSDDQTGTAPWGCLIVNKSRFLRRKIASAGEMPWVGFLDSLNPQEYVLVLHRQ